MPTKGFRFIASGSVTIAANTTTTVVTTTKNTDERIFISSYITDNTAGVTWAEQGAALGVADSVTEVLRRTANANEFSLVARNTNVALGPSRTLEYLLMAALP